MSKKLLVDQMIHIREEMSKLNLRLLSQASAKSFFQDSVKDQNTADHDKIRKYSHKLISFKSEYFNKYFVSEPYFFELLNSQKFEDLLLFSLKFLCKLLKVQTKPTPTPTSIQKKHTPLERVTKMIKDIVNPLQFNVSNQSSLYASQLLKANKSCQTISQSEHKKPDKLRHLNHQLALRQASLLSSIYHESPALSSPKFNKTLVDTSFERSSLKKDYRSHDHLPDTAKDTQTQKIPFPSVPPLITVPSQFQECKSQSSANDKNNISMASSFADTAKKKQRPYQLLENKRFPKREVPKEMLSVDYVAKKRKTPERKRDFDIITNG